MHVSPLRYWSFKLISLGGMALAVFALPHLMSGQPVTLYENWPANAQQRARLISDYGFDSSRGNGALRVTRIGRSFRISGKQPLVRLCSYYGPSWRAAWGQAYSGVCTIWRPG